MNDTDVRFHLLHTYILKRVWSSRCFQHKWGHKYTNNIPRTAQRVTSWAFDRFIWVKRSSYHIYIGYRNLKGSHGNLSKYKFGLAEYITVYVIQLQQLLQLLLRIITQYAISSMTSAIAQLFHFNWLAEAILKMCHCCASPWKLIICMRFYALPI